MRVLGLLVASVVVVLGLVAVAMPEFLIAIGRHVMSPSGLYAAAAFRIGSGIVLILSARESRARGFLSVAGAANIVSGAATPILGVGAALARLEWEAAHVTFFRLEGVAFVCLGAFLVSALRPPN